MPPLLTVEDLTVQFRTDAGWLTAIEGVGFELDERACLGIVGESGSGKSVTALSVLRLHAQATTRIVSGRIRYGDRDLLRLPGNELRRIRGGEIAMIFQDPMSSLNPVLTVADQIEETLRLHQDLTRQAARRRAVELAPRSALYSAPQHPYTQALLAAVPHPVLDRVRTPPIGGEVPSRLVQPSGCRFHTRCPHAFTRCRIEAPALRETAPGHFAACHLHERAA